MSENSLGGRELFDIRLSGVSRRISYFLFSRVAAATLQTDDSLVGSQAADFFADGIGLAVTRWLYRF